MSLNQIGIDLGGSKTEIVVLQAGLEVFRRRVSTPSHSYISILNMISSLIETSQARLEEEVTIGIGMPGALTAGGLVKNSNTVCLNGRPFKVDIEKKLGQQVTVMNDANCFALSEAIDGAAKHHAVVFGVILGTGVGGGIVINHDPLIGVNSIAGEWGHNALPESALRINSDNRRCYCGKENCIETYLSGAGFSQSYFELTSENKSPRVIADLLSLHDKAAEEVFDIYCKQLAASLALVINVLDPDIIVLGGGLSNFNLLASTVKRYLPDYVFSDSVRTRVVANQHGDSSGVRGAAWLGIGCNNKV